MSNDNKFILSISFFALVTFIGLVMAYGQDYPLSIAAKFARILWAL